MWNNKAEMWKKKKKGRDVSPESCPRWRFPGMYEVREQLVEKEIFQGAEENGHAAPSLWLEKLVFTVRYVTWEAYV